jgi:hypothetical protein
MPEIAGVRCEILPDEMESGMHADLPAAAASHFSDILGQHILET